MLIFPSSLIKLKHDRRRWSRKGDAKAGKPATGIDHRYSVRVELYENPTEWIQRKGFSEEYGAMNLERVVNQMLGTMIAAALLGGKITTGKTIRLIAADGQIQFHHSPSH